MSKSSPQLRSSLIKLASSQPSLRAHLLPLLSETPSARKASYSGQEIFYKLVDKGDFIKVFYQLKKDGDEQSAKLLRDVMNHFIKKFELSNGEQDALGRMSNVKPGMDSAGIRNFVFKAANSLGMHLPSAMFASQSKKAYQDPNRMTPEDAMAEADETLSMMGERMKDVIQNLREQQFDLHREEQTAERAWHKADWTWLANQGYVDKKDVDFVTKVMSMYSW